MAVSIVTWSCMLLTCLLISASSVGSLNVGDDVIARAFLDNQQNKSIIWSPLRSMGLDGLVTGLKAYMVNINDCIRLQVWRPPSTVQASLSTPSTQSTPLRATTPTFPTLLTTNYWLLVQQTVKCVRAETANRTFIYDLPRDERIRFESNDVLGFSFYPKSPIPYDKQNITCSRRGRAQAAMREPAVMLSGSVYGFTPLSNCRKYSLQASVLRKDCVRLIPIRLAQNLTFTSSGRDYEDTCWRIESLLAGDSDMPIIIYLKYLVMTIPDCSVGYVDIREGRSSTSPLIQRDCQMPSGENIELKPITTGVAYIHLLRRRNQGKTITVTIQYSNQKILPPSCQKLPLTEKPILFASPNYPHHYPPNADICWKLTIAGSSMNRVRIELAQGVDLQPPVGCTGTSGYRACAEQHCKDFIEVQDGNGALLTKWCDHTGQDLIETSSGQTMTIKFVSDATIQGTGFQIKAFSVHPKTAQCTHYLALFEAAPLQTPYYPYTYPSNRDDCWSVRANSPDLRLLLIVEDSSLEPDVLCIKDFVEVRDGASSSSPLLRRWCGMEMPKSVLTSGGYLYVRFVSNGNLNYRGFAFSYRQVSSDACTIYYAYSHREYLKPDLGQTATGYDIRCWVLRSEKGKLRVRWDSLGPSTKTTICGNTYIELRDGDHMTAPLLGKYCQDSPIPPDGVSSTGGAIYVRWVSDFNSRPANFRLVYMSLSSSHCPLLSVGNAYEVLYLENHLPGMSTTGYPSYYQRTSSKPPTNRPVQVNPCEACKYGPNQQRCWTIEADPGYTSLIITIRFLELQNKDDRGQCKYDFVEMRDGNSGDDPLLATLCGTVKSRNYTTTGRWLLVHFHSDAEIELRGFQIEVRGYKGKETCTTLEARNYNNAIQTSSHTPFPANTKKCWTIRSPSTGKPIKIFAQHITLDLDDVIDFYDGPSSDDIQLRRFDASTRFGATVMSSGSSLTVVLRTGERSTSRGQFYLQYSWVYGGLCSYVSIEEEPAYITTKDFGSKNYTKNDYLCWVMTVLDPSHTIEITAEKFILEDGVRCSADYLQIYDGPKMNDDKLLHRWCGEMSGQVLALSSSRSLYAVFASNDRLHFPGFRLKVMSRLGQVKVPGEKQDRGDGSEGPSSNNSVVIALVVIGVILILILIVFVFLWNRKRMSASDSVARVEAPAPVVVYTQPPAYRPPSMLGAVGQELPIEERKIPLPAAEEVSPEQMPPPRNPTPSTTLTTPTTPTTPTTTADTSTLL